MARKVIGKKFVVHCTCDRCGDEDRTDSDGSIATPPGWAYLWIDQAGTRQRQEPLFCPACVAALIAAAAPAILQV